MYCYFTVDENNIVGGIIKAQSRQEHLLEDGYIELEDKEALQGKKYNAETRTFEDVEILTEEEVFRAKVLSSLEYLELKSE